MKHELADLVIMLVLLAKFRVVRKGCKLGKNEQSGYKDWKICPPTRANSTLIFLYPHHMFNNIYLQRLRRLAQLFKIVSLWQKRITIKRG